MRDDDDSTAATPRWVKVTGAVAIAVVVLFVVLLVIGRGHGPGRHTDGAVRDGVALGAVLGER